MLTVSSTDRIFILAGAGVSAEKRHSNFSSIEMQPTWLRDWMTSMREKLKAA
jgi:hypothetical protein